MKKWAGRKLFLLLLSTFLFAGLVFTACGSGSAEALELQNQLVSLREEKEALEADREALAEKVSGLEQTIAEYEEKLNYPDHDLRALAEGEYQYYVAFSVNGGPFHKVPTQIHVQSGDVSNRYVLGYSGFPAEMGYVWADGQEVHFGEPITYAGVDSDAGQVDVSCILLNEPVQSGSEDAARLAQVIGNPPSKEAAQAQAQAPAETPPVDEPPPVTESRTVYITNTGEKHHAAGCRYLKQSQIAISIDAARGQGYTPCSVCGGG